MIDPDRVVLCFIVSGDIAAIAVPTAKMAKPADGLWKHTCFEMFSRCGSDSAYSEINLSPSSEWACYTFDGYRSGMRSVDALAPDIHVQCSDDAIVLHAQAVLTEGTGPWHIALSAVIEETDGTKSYWALAHPPGAPDFHHPDCFALTLPAPGSS